MKGSNDVEIFISKYQLNWQITTYLPQLPQSIVMILRSKFVLPIQLYPDVRGYSSCFEIKIFEFFVLFLLCIKIFNFF